MCWHTWKLIWLTFFNSTWVFTHNYWQYPAVGKVGNFFDKSMINEMVSVDFEEVQKIRNYLSFNQGIFVGISSGANVLAAFNESKKWDSSKTIVTIAPDSGRSYLELFNQ